MAGGTVDQKQKTWREEEQAAVKRVREAFDRWQSAWAVPAQRAMQDRNDKRAIENAIREADAAREELKTAEAVCERIKDEIRAGRRY
jgi:hypothetical protein